MSGMLREAKTIVLESLKGFGQVFNITAVQLSKMAQKTNEEEAQLGVLDWAKTWQSFLIWLYLDAAKKSYQINLPNWYLFHKHLF